MADSEGIALESGATPSRTARGAAQTIGSGLAAWLPALPLLLLALLMLVLPTVGLVLGSFGIPRGATLEYWIDTFQSNGSRQAIWTSIRLGLASAAVALLVGGPLAWMISRLVTASRAMWLAILNVAANFGGIGLAFGYMAELGTYGMVTLALQQVRLPWVPPEIGSFASLVMAYSYTNVPHFVLLTLPAVSIVRQEWPEATAVCAASP